MRLLLYILALWSVSAASTAAAPIVFLCSWESRTPIKITVDPENMTASRDDGGSPYKVVKLTKWGVWLEVVMPDNVAGAAIQMIQRSEVVEPEKAGLWLDVVIPVTGNVTAIEGGHCWELG